MSYPQYIEFRTRDGGVVLIEKADIKFSGVRKAGLSRSDLIEFADKTLEQALESLRANAQAIANTISEMEDPPDELKVTFGIKFSGEINAFTVVKLGGDATYEIVLTWKDMPGSEHS